MISISYLIFHIAGYIYLSRYSIFTYYYNLRHIYCNLVIHIFRKLFKAVDMRMLFSANSKDNLVYDIDFNYQKLEDS